MKLLQFLRIIIFFLIRKPFPNFIVNLFLMIKWKCYISLGAQISNPLNVKIGKRTVIGRCIIKANSNKRKSIKYTISIGSDSRIHSDTHISAQDGYIFIGDKCSLNPFSLIYGSGGVKIDSYTRIGSNTSIIASSHNFSDRNSKILESTFGKGILIGSDVWIGTGVRIQDGITIEDRSIIGSGTVVNKNIPIESIAYGVPVKIKENRFT